MSEHRFDDAAHDAGADLGRLARAGDATRLAGAQRSRRVERILDLTTREDLTWRGDLSLWARFLRDRMRHSFALRVAAAVLAMHVLGLSVLAIHVLRSPAEPFIRTGIELPPEPPYWEVEEEPLEDLDVRDPGEEPAVQPVPTRGGR